MNNKNEHIDFENLIVKYLSGEVTDAEVNILESWVKESKENKKKFIDYKKAWRIAHSSKTEFNPANAWNKIEKGLLGEKPRSKVISFQNRTTGLSWGYRIAATIAILFTIGYTYFYFINPPQKELLASNGILIEQLPDGSEITLNQNSTLIYSRKFNKKERRVNLSGDAFFEVARNEEKPFIIETDGVTVKVLGTSFYVDARNENPEVKVIVNSGKVEVVAKEKEKFVLLAGETATFIKRKKQLVKGQSKDKNYLAWKTKHLVFDDTPMMEVISMLQKTYQIKIQLSSNELSNCRLTSTFNQLEISVVFDILQETFPSMSVTKTGETYIIKGTGCEE
ncbi:MAG: FecR domain-containing protein [Bacteroidales bacterium]|nr:FecR domain-containing protein [Bacteroidales bacterium]MCF8402438.1 FecR domain-containing protein [Bacteroidales bacterium]